MGAAPAEGLVQMQMMIPDSMVGAVLGRRGSTVVEIQNFTGARIQISQRGDFVAGTSNRYRK
ncbi:unnamed protein product, partial [Phaeothamnion confervicola]